MEWSGRAYLSGVLQKAIECNTNYRHAHTRRWRFSLLLGNSHSGRRPLNVCVCLFIR